MKLTNKPMNIFSTSKKICAGAALALACAANAQTFSYNNGDLLVGFRLTAGGNNDLVVKAGTAASFTNMTPGSTISIANLNGTLLKNAFGTTNNLSWSAFGCFDASYPDVAQQNTLFMTSARTDNSIQSSPWPRYKASFYANTVSKIEGAGTGAYYIGSGLPSAVNINQPNYLIESESWNVAPNFSYNSMVGVAGNWDGFGITEQATSSTFTSDGVPVRADLYWIVPGGTFVSHPPSSYLGYFELSTSGALTFTAAAVGSVTTPVITGITRVGNLSTVNFTTGASGTYTLLASSTLTAPKASWTVLGSVSGNGAVNSLTETTTATPRFYLISAQ